MTLDRVRKEGEGEWSSRLAGVGGVVGGVRRHEDLCDGKKVLLYTRRGGVEHEDSGLVSSPEDHLRRDCGGWGGPG